MFLWFCAEISFTGKLTVGNILVNDINEEVCNNLLKFTDDAQFFSQIATRKDYRACIGGV